MVAPLTRIRPNGEPLRRPAEIEAEIADAVARDAAELAEIAARDPTAEGLSSECMVHLIRRATRAQNGSSGLNDILLPILLRRVATRLRGAVRGFDPALRDEVCEEILGRLAIALVEPGDAADFFEVRFDLALKRLRIDVSRRLRRRAEVPLDETEDGAASNLEGNGGIAWDATPRPLDPEQLACLRLALAALPDAERRAIVLHRLVGLPICSKSPETLTLVGVLQVSERTVRNRLRRAEARLMAPVPAENVS